MTRPATSHHPRPLARHHGGRGGFFAFTRDGRVRDSYGVYVAGCDRTDAKETK